MKLSFLSEKQQRMVDDDTYLDVDPSDVKSLLLLLKQHGCDDLVRKMRIKYWDLIDDKEKRLMTELGLSYEKNDIALKGVTFFIDGYSEKLWRALFVDGYEISANALSRHIHTLDDAVDVDAANRLRTKYAHVFESSKKENLLKHGVSSKSDIKEKVTSFDIDGESPAIWKALHDPNYLPNKSTITVILQTLEAREDDEAAEFVYDKYKDIFYFDDGPIELKQSFEEIQAYVDVIAGRHIELKRWVPEENHRKRSRPVHNNTLERGCFS